MVGEAPNFRLYIFLKGTDHAGPNRPATFRRFIGNGARPSIGSTPPRVVPPPGGLAGAPPAGGVFAVGTRRSRQRSRSRMLCARHVMHHRPTLCRHARGAVVAAS